MTTPTKDEARAETVIERANGDIHVTDALGRMATLHWSRFHGLIVSTQDNAVYLGQPETVAWLASRVSTPPSEDEARAKVIAELRWLADARDEYSTDVFPVIHEQAQTARHLADILERKTPVAEGGEGFGWLPSWKWDEWDALASRVSTPPSEPGGCSAHGRRECREDICDGEWNPETGSYSIRPATPPTDEDEREALVGRVEGVKALLGEIYHHGLRMLSVDFDPAYEALEDAVRALRRQVPSTPETNWEYGATHVDPDKPVSIRDSLHEAREAQAYYDRIISEWNARSGRHHSPSNIYRRTKAAPAGPWEPVPTTEGEA